MAPLPQPLAHTALAIDAAYVAAARDGDSLGVPMSGVGHPCDRHLWYAFRWAAPRETPTGRRERIFKTGALYERRILDDLRMIGCDVAEVDESTGAQHRVELADGHLRGKVDGVAIGLPEAPTAFHIVEAKSANERSWKEIARKGVEAAKPEHYAQCQLYMHGTGIYRALYVCANKNTDEIHAERLKYDPALCAALVARVERIVAADVPPPRLHDDPTSKAAFACQFCPARAQCHDGAFARRNCRTCIEARTAPGPRWSCALRDVDLRYGDQQAGCPDHRYAPGLVPGSQVDADPGARTITYRRPDGAAWIDDGRAAC